MVIAREATPIAAVRRRSGAAAVSTLPSLTRSFPTAYRGRAVWQLGRKNGGNYKIDRAVLERTNRRARDRIVTVAHTIAQSTTLHGE
jgi:hypothetical protein